MLNWLQKEWRFTIALLAFCTFWGLALSGQLPFALPQSSAQISTTEGNQSHPLADWWNWLTKDSISFFTAVLAVFTGGLVVVALQAKDISRRQTRIAERQHELEVQQHFLANRPHLAIRNVRAIEPGVGNPIKIGFEVINNGSSDAVILASWFEAEFAEGYDALTPTAVGDPPKNFIGRETLTVNEVWRKKVFVGKRNWQQADFSRATDRQGFFWMGKILYLDGNGQNRRLGVIRKYATHTGRFRPLPDTDTDYEYDD